LTAKITDWTIVCAAAQALIRQVIAELQIYFTSIDMNTDLLGQSCQKLKTSNREYQEEKCQNKKSILQ
jgi:hypothetical protein